MKTEVVTNAGNCPVDGTVRPTHWMDSRRFVLTDAQREKLGGDYQYFYNVPCKMVRGKAKPLHICNYCEGTGEDVDEGGSCDACGGAGGLPAAA